MVTVRLRMLSLVVLFTLPISTLQGCYNDENFKQEMSKEGYSWCTPQHDLLYVKGFKRDGSGNDLRDFKSVKCCQPPPVHREKPSTCTSADWDMSFSRCVRSRYRSNLSGKDHHKLKTLLRLHVTGYDNVW